MGELSAEVELIVSDNASTDDTEHVVKVATRYSPIRYSRNAKNVGLCRNIVRSVQLAKGVFCWTLGDDDFARPGALKKVVEVLKNYPEVDYVYVNYSHIGLQELRRLPYPPSSKDLADDLRLDNEDPTERYVSAWEELIDPKINTTFLANMQPSVTRRSFWSKYSGTLELGELGSSLDATYPHARVLGSTLVGKRAYYIGKPLFVVVDGAREWWDLVTVIRLLRLNDVLDFYERMGVDPARINRCREYLLKSSGPWLLQVLTGKSTAGREYFSAPRYFLHYWKYKTLWLSIFETARTYDPPICYVASALLRAVRRL